MKIYKFYAFGGCNTLMYIIHWNGLNFVKYEGSILFLVSPVSLWLLLLFSLSKFVCFRDFVIVVIIICVQNGFLVLPPFSWESEFCGSLLLGLFRVFGILQKASESQKIYYIFNLISSCSHNSFMTIKQVLFLIFSKKVKIYYSITAKNFHFIMAYWKWWRTK